jgi:acetyl-CoA carboxylase biotin carboxyl carrier protein
MPENPPGPIEADNVRAIRQLVRLMKRYDLTAIDFMEGSTQIRLRRRGPETSRPTSTSATPQSAPLPVAPPVIPTAPVSPPAPTGVMIESPMVGTYYSSSSPDAPPFISVGSQVRADSTVCVIEAMKVFTDIPAGVSGIVAEILVKNGQPVEYGQSLFRINPA